MRVLPVNMPKPLISVSQSFAFGEVFLQAVSVSFKRSVGTFAVPFYNEMEGSTFQRGITRRDNVFTLYSKSNRFWQFSNRPVLNFYVWKAAALSLSYTCDTRIDPTTISAASSQFRLLARLKGDLSVS
ncbi:hypothetical protein SAMN05216236_1317 [Sedimentitalea nanhaiensis]|uniref:Uncharacterized protein n=1 Tax=Sedimentitalea nanhaiensis TaxID=999627 RepID=A0A1I7DN09_9RHOB|nr:hypothetical protein SAMN05216236_1317 [Sedimentitalea nanhaiensis]